MSYYYAYFDRYYTDRVFIKANNEAEALEYFNKHFKNRGKAVKTYFATGNRYEADATIKDEKPIDKLISEAQDKVQEKPVGNSEKEIEI